MAKVGAATMLLAARPHAAARGAIHCVVLLPADTHRGRGIARWARFS